MFTTIDKALISLVTAVLSIAAMFGVAMPSWLDQTAIASFFAAVSPLLVYLVPNK